MTTQQICINAARRALDRAYTEGTHERFQLFESDGEHAEGLFENEIGALYWVTETSCSCPAGAHGRICKHYAALFDLTGMLDRILPGCYERGFAVAPQLAA